MNETMERQIRQLRLKGLGYKSIGLAVETSKENVRYYCGKHGLDGRADLTALNFDERKLLAYGNSKRKYCCQECYIQDRFRTSQDAKITDAEIKRRQELAK